MGKESQTHAKVQCMRGTDNQNLCPPIMGCYTLGVTSRLRLGSLPCIVCCMLRFAYAHGVPSRVSVMTPPRYWHLSIRFSFFQLCLPPRFSSPPGAPTDINVYGGDPDKEIEGATTCNFGAHIVG